MWGSRVGEQDISAFIYEYLTEVDPNMFKNKDSFNDKIAT